MVVRRDASRNLVVYLTKHQEGIERALRAHDGTVEGGFRTAAFARLLDAHFYVGACDLRAIWSHDG